MEVIQNKKSIESGIYVVLDPSMDEHVLLDKLQIILTKNIVAIQIWDNFKKGQDSISLIRKINLLCEQHQTPVLINNRWQVLKFIDLDGIHFDTIPSNLDEITKEINKEILLGLTCGNDLEDVKWAANNNIDYISFCSMFPSLTANDCEIIPHDIVKQAALIFEKPVFLAGGIDPKNLKQLEELKYDGIAVISGIINTEYPDKAIDGYRENLKLIK